VLAKEAPDRASRIALDLRVPDPCDEEDIPRLAHRLEHISENAGGAPVTTTAR
jgi:hypothetical protein